MKAKTKSKRDKGRGVIDDGKLRVISQT